MTSTNVNASARIEGFTITFGGDAFGSGNYPGQHHEGGGGMRNMNGGSPMVVKCKFTRNGGRYGGGMWNRVESNPIVIGCTFELCGVETDGGGIYFSDDSSGYLIGCTFRANFAGGDGGGIYGGAGISMRLNSSPAVLNCTFVGNQSYQSGGGARVGSGCESRFTNCTFAHNRSVNAGSGVSINNRSATNPVRIVKLENCVFWGNEVTNPPCCPTGSQIALIGEYPSDVTVIASDSQGGEADVYVEVHDPPSILNWEASNIDANPLFLISPNPGHDGHWGTSDDNYGDLRLPYGSPCVDRAEATSIPPDDFDVDNDSNFSEATPDIDLQSRVVNCADMGSGENQIDYTCDGDCAGGSPEGPNGMVDIDDLVAVIVNWGAGGAGDVAPATCGNGITNIDDLVMVITNWGACEGGGGGGSIPTSFQECWDKCSANFETGSENWQTCMDACVQALCELGYTQYCP